jgi:hypothetical protein
LMRDRLLIYAGLVVFLGLITSPISYNLMARRTAKGPDIRLPAQEKRCVAPVEYMKTSHMKLLLEWRDDVVRRNVRTYAASDGKAYAMSLTGTCLEKCHTDKAEFCDRCHSYAGVQGPYCFDCHVDPKEVKRSGL